MKNVNPFGAQGIYVIDRNAIVNQPQSNPALQTTKNIDIQVGKKNKKLRQWIAAIIATMALFMMGMTLGWSSPVIEKLQQPDSKIFLTDEEISWTASILYLGSMASPLPTGLLMDHFGRKAALYFTALEALLSWIILLTANSATGIYIARFLGGMVGGSSYTVAPIYLCEIAEPEVRGALNSIFTLLAYFGIMFEYSIAPNVSYTMLNLLSALVPLFVSILVYFIPESPYFYMMKEKRESASKSLAWLRCTTATSDVETELNCIAKSVSEDMKNKKSVFDLFRTAGNRRALMMTEALAIFQRLSGISVIMAYAASAAPSSWVITNDQCAMLICLTWIIFGFWSTGLVDRLGRKRLMVISCAGCGIAMGSFGTINYLENNTNIDVSSFNWLPFVILIIYSAFFSVGLGCVPNVIQGEVFSANTKGTASGLTSMIIALTSFTTNKLYQPIGATVGYHVNYLIYTISCIFGVYFGLFLLIETKGKTLQQIQVELSQGNQKLKNPITLPNWRGSDCNASKSSVQLSVCVKRVNKMVMKSVTRQYAAACAASLGFVMQGQSLGWPSPVLKKIEQTGEPMDLTPSEEAWMVSLLYAGNFISPIPAGYLMDMFGRKRTAVVLSALSFISWILAIFATNAEMLYISRFLNGLWSGVATTILPMYFGEISEPSVRGALSTLIQLMVYLGVFYEYTIGPFVTYKTLGILTAIVPVIFFILFLCMPESPYWFVMKNNHEKAQRSLEWLRAGKDKSEVNTELRAIRESVQEQMKNKRTYKDLISTQGHRKGLIIVQVLSILQRASGISGLMAYTSITLPPEGYDPNTCVLIMGGIWVISVFISTLLIDKLGRRPLLAISTLGSGLAMGMNAVWFYLRYKTDMEIESTYIIPVLALFTYGIFFSIGLGPIASTVQAEYFPSNTKGIASAITSISLALTSFIMNKIYLHIKEEIGMYFNFVIFTISCFLCFLFVLFYVIETKGKTLQQIQEKLER
ncbi:uncharacterized protein LOC142320830 [Lycorma delicatula]|uniref:uncharacterized protein LOC142320830 n=1 Tax=Lycorma delicatula TaxID=130591 RepID=UPI003F5181BC